ncbi:unnamed protein product [Orchesella dallaii]|uniref:26S proteasome non-ATPase regulatory subunit 9 n=1 Tax=Orchesella dallaii TaxID=48710 RepID=A0ABP1RTK2_9HEXA
MKENQAPLIMASQGEEAVVTREDILKLMKARDEIDEKIVALGGILESNRVGMTEPLVDQEGYPRNDIDVYQVRHARHKIICFQNDYKALTKRIDSSLAKYHQRLKDQGTSGTPMAMEVDSPTSEVVLSPIAKVNLVSEGSPAFHAGLKVDDVVLSFGSLDSTNFTELSQIGSLVQRSVGSMVSVKVKRNVQTVKLALIPGPWSGRGLLGCNIIPYDAIDR